MEGKLGVVAKALQSLATTAGLTLSDTTVSQQNPDYGAASVPPSTGQLIEFARTLSRKQSRYFSLLKSEVGASYTLTHLMVSTDFIVMTFHEAVVDLTLYNSPHLQPKRLISRTRSRNMNLKLVASMTGFPRSEQARRLETMLSSICCELELTCFIPTTDLILMFSGYAGSQTQLVPSLSPWSGFPKWLTKCSCPGKYSR